MSESILSVSDFHYGNFVLKNCSRHHFSRIPESVFRKISRMSNTKVTLKQDEMIILKIVRV